MFVIYRPDYVVPLRARQLCYETISHLLRLVIRRITEISDTPSDYLFLPLSHCARFTHRSVWNT